MPGLWSSVSGALDAGKQVLFDETASSQRQQQIDSEQALTQQKIADDKAEQARAQREDDYKSSMEKMGALKEQSENVFQEAQPTIAVLNHAQTLQGADRDAYMKTKQYQDAHDAYHGKGGYGERINSLGDQYQQHLSDIAGYHADVAREKAPQTAFDIQQYGWGGTRPGDAYDYVSAVSGRPASDFIQRNGGPSQIEGSIHQLQQGIQAGSLDGLGPDATALLTPLLNTHQGQRDGAGNIIGQTHVVGVSMDPANQGNVILHTAHEMHGADGTTKVQGAPQGEGISVPVQQVMGYIGNLSQMANKVDDPDAQKKLREAEDNGDTAMHRVLQDAGRAGVPLESVYGPQPKPVIVPAGSELVQPGIGGAPATALAKGQAKASTAAQRQPFIDILSDPNSSEEEKAAAIDQLASINAAEKGYSEKKNPNLRSDGGSGGGTPKTRAAWLSQRMATLQAQGLKPADANKQAQQEWPSDADKPSVTTSDTDVDPKTGKKHVVTRKDRPGDPEVVTGPNKPKGTKWVSKDGKTTRVSLGDGKWQTQQ